MDVIVCFQVQGSFTPVLDLRAVFTTLLGFLHLWVNFSLQRFLSGDAGADVSCFSHRLTGPRSGLWGQIMKLRQASQGFFGYKRSNSHCLRAAGLTFKFWIMNSS